MQQLAKSVRIFAGRVAPLMIGVVALVATLPAAAEIGPYVGLEAGWSANPDAPFTETVNQATTQPPSTLKTTVHGSARFSSGMVGGATFGYALPGHLRPELEVNYRRNSVSETGVGFSAIAIMGNLWYDFEQNHTYFYVGGGLGDLHLHFSHEDHGDSTDAFGGQVGAGAGFFLTPQLSIGINYRYAMAFAHSDFKLGPTSVQRADGSIITSSLRERIRYRSQTVMLGFRYSFGGFWNPAGVGARPPLPPRVVPVQRSN